jgi:glycerophosphoryl diester phosphodiesterase
MPNIEKRALRANLQERAEAILQQISQQVVDFAAALIPQPPLTLPLLKTARIVAHRGSHDHGATIHENTLPAFERAIQAGVWGIEFDIRLTRDNIPVVIHDDDCRRVFGVPQIVSQTNFSELKRSIPEIPSLDEVITAYGQHTHLMIELKDLGQPYSHNQLRALERCWSDLEPARDFHLLSLSSEVINKTDIVPKSAFIAVSETNTAQMSDLALTLELGGYAGHYALITSERIQKHHDLGQKVGTGFPNSRNVLRRELGRGVDWVFTNHTLELMAILEHEATARGAR